MAGPKLSKEKRAELRKDLGEQAPATGDLAALVRNLASKFGISETAVRWHHKKVMGGSGSAKPARRKPNRPKGTVAKKSARKRRRTGGPGRPSSFRTLATELSKISPADLRRAIKASKLQVKHDTLVAQATHLRRQLKGAERRARVLERRIAQVLSV